MRATRREIRVHGVEVHPGRLFLLLLPPCALGVLSLAFGFWLWLRAWLVLALAASLVLVTFALGVLSLAFGLGTLCPRLWLWNIVPSVSLRWLLAWLVLR